jgi:hypothetical protein
MERAFSLHRGGERQRLAPGPSAKINDDLPRARRAGQCDNLTASVLHFNQPREFRAIRERNVFRQAESIGHAGDRLRSCKQRQDIVPGDSQRVDSHVKWCATKKGGMLLRWNL